MLRPLTGTNKNNEPLHRPPRVEQQINACLELSSQELIEKASVEDPANGDYLCSEALVYLIRNDFRYGDHQLLEELTPILLGRCSANLRRKVHGYREPILSTIREEIMGRLAELLVMPGDAADFFEVRFSLSLARLRIDVCNHYQRHEEHTLRVDDLEPEEGSAYNRVAAYGQITQPMNQEEQVALHEALERLNPEERTVLLLHRLGGVPINAGDESLVTLLGKSERTIRNRLRAAEAQLASWKEVKT